MSTSTDPATVSAALLSALRHDIVERRIASGMARLDEHAGFLQTLDPVSEHAPQIVWRLAQWVDVGWRDVDLLQAILARVPRNCRASLALRDYAAIRMAE